MKMHSLLKVFVACLVLMEVKSQNFVADDNVIEALMNHTIAECKVKENASPEDVQAVFQDEEWPETPEGKCFIECFFQEIGIFKNHKFHKRGFIALALMFSEASDESSEEIELVRQAIRRISGECGSATSDDRCENAFNFAKCSDDILESLSLVINDLHRHEPENDNS